MRIFFTQTRIIFKVKHKTRFLMSLLWKLSLHSKEVLFLMAVPLRGVGVKALPFREKNFFGAFFYFVAI